MLESIYLERKYSLSSRNFEIVLDNIHNIREAIHNRKYLNRPVIENAGHNLSHKFIRFSSSKCYCQNIMNGFDLANNMKDILNKSDIEKFKRVNDMRTINSIDPDKYFKINNWKLVQASKNDMTDYLFGLLSVVPKDIMRYALKALI